ncbi:MAG: response regulator [Bacteroidota bacterium]|nr:response regulator [Bacteroidota bacterium]MDP4216850.1 response regulator [Bacteroidota bacterium]MDP4247526.1 response regulator [Bacteroidota bacterium]MDP4255062.1 response regulator [Bacteroidota bacterium]MDP4260520.1 response regulator [Bacteroidota bacterium]
MKKILIIDDDKDLLTSMKSLFSKNGFDIAVTMSCDEGLSILKNFKPDLIFLDMNVGDEDGREMCKKIKEQAEYSHMPVVLISSDHEGEKQYKEYGANSFVKKPLQFSTLLDIVKKGDNLN